MNGRNLSYEGKNADSKLNEEAETVPSSFHLLPSAEKSFSEHKKSAGQIKVCGEMCKLSQAYCLKFMLACNILQTRRNHLVNGKSRGIITDKKNILIRREVLILTEKKYVSYSKCYKPKEKESAHSYPSYWTYQQGSKKTRKNEDYAKYSRNHE